MIYFHTTHIFCGILDCMVTFPFCHLALNSTTVQMYPELRADRSCSSPMVPDAIFPHTLPMGILLLSDPVVFVTLPTMSPVADVCTSGWPVSSQYPNSAAEFEVFVLGL